MQIRLLKIRKLVSVIGYYTTFKIFCDFDKLDIISREHCLIALFPQLWNNIEADFCILICYFTTKRKKKKIPYLVFFNIRI